MQNEVVEEKILRQYDQILVTPIDKAKMDAEVHEELVKQHGKPKEGFLYETNDNLAVVKGLNLIIDKECVGNVDFMVEIHIYYKDTVKLNLFIAPAATLKISIAELIERYGLPETTLPEFMGERFNYNRRIRSNMWEVLKEYLASK